MRELLLEDHELTLVHQPGFGAWTYHLRIPDTADIDSRWGVLKVSGTIDGYPIQGINLAPRKGEDKLISIKEDQGRYRQNRRGYGARHVVFAYLIRIARNSLQARLDSTSTALAHPCEKLCS